MDQALWKILGFLLAAILLFVTPLISVYDRQDDISYTIAYSQVQELTDMTRDRGYLDEALYLKLNKILAATGNTYEITLEHYKKTYVPVYDDAGLFMDDFYVSYEGYFNGDIEKVLENQHRYDLSIGDLFFVRVENKSKTKSQVIREILLNISTDYPTIIIRSGGMVRHEPH